MQTIKFGNLFNFKLFVEVLVTNFTNEDSINRRFQENPNSCNFFHKCSIVVNKPRTFLICPICLLFCSVIKTTNNISIDTHTGHKVMPYPLLCQIKLNSIRMADWNWNFCVFLLFFNKKCCIGVVSIFLFHEKNARSEEKAMWYRVGGNKEYTFKKNLILTRAID